MTTLLSHNRTYGTIRLNTSGAWVIDDMEPHVRIRLKSIFPRVPKNSAPPFVLVGGAQLDADLDWFLARYPLAISESDRAKMRVNKVLFETGQAELQSLLAPGWKPSAITGFRDGERPYDYQAQAAELARRTGRLLIADEVGLGKTVAALASIADAQYLPALVVPQTHLVQQWIDMIQQFTHLSVHAFRTMSPYELPPADIYVCPYSKLGGWIDYAESAGFRSVVFDECQELRSGRGTSKGNAAAAFRARMDLAVFLSGTPIYNYGSEIFQIMDIVEPGALGTWLEFTTEWCTIGPGGKWIVENPQALGAYLRERHLMLRRTNDDVGNEFKRVNVVTHEIPHDAEVLAEDADLMRQLAQQVTSGTFVEKGQAAREFDNLLRQATGLSKAPHVAAFVKLLLDAGLPVVLFGWHRAVYDLWMEKLAAYNPVLFTGSETPRQKEKAKKLFTDGHTNLFIMSLRSGAGLDGLQHRAHTVVFGELDWSPQVHHQCTGRLHRPGQKNQVDAFYLVSDGGSDPTVVRILGLKASQSRGILDPLAGASEQHTDTTRIRALAEAYLSGAMTAAKPMPKVIEVSVASPQIELFGVRV